jgi:hypothetical protein
LNATYGWRRIGGARTPMPPPYGSYAHPIPPEKVYGDYSPRCIGCPYPRHGLMCQSKEEAGCLRTDMQKLEQQWLAEKERRLSDRPSK